MSNRKRRGKRERAHVKYMAKCRAHERAVARRARFKRTMEHRRNLVNKLDDAVFEQPRRKETEPTRKVSFFRRLLGRRS